MRRHWAASPYFCSAIVSSVSPDWTSYVSPAVGSLVALGETAAAAGGGGGDAPSEANVGRAGLGATAGATEALGTIVGVGVVAAPAPHAALNPSVSSAHAARTARLSRIRRELQVRR